MATLYGVYRSRATRIFWLAAELGLRLTHVPVIQASKLSDPLAEGAPLNTRSPKFLKVSPLGAIPVLEDDGFILTESLTINLYLARKYGGGLAAQTGQEDALMQQWAMFGLASLEPHTLPLFYAAGKGSDEGLGIAPHIAALTQPLQDLNRHLGTTGFMVGDRFTVADINMAEIVRYAQFRPGLVEGYPAINDWMRTCQARPGFKAMWAAREAEAE